uniref:Uncharacterized protein n=1 Tax=Periophthalmus magnuspinnatus TaxID=409849 RepID=A0A3B4AUF5_9GOBI
MAELVQGQASINQPALKSDGLVDAFQRARQVNNSPGSRSASLPHQADPFPPSRHTFFGGQSQLNFANLAVGSKLGSVM